MRLWHPPVHRLLPDALNQTKREIIEMHDLCGTHVLQKLVAMASLAVLSGMELFVLSSRGGAGVLSDLEYISRSPFTDIGLFYVLTQ